MIEIEIFFLSFLKKIFKSKFKRLQLFAVSFIDRIPRLYNFVIRELKMKNFGYWICIKQSAILINLQRDFILTKLREKKTRIYFKIVFPIHFNLF